jgi:hypothetical protein
LTELADKGINVRVIQALARHKDMSTTQRYIDYNESKLRNAGECPIFCVCVIRSMLPNQRSMTTMTISKELLDDLLSGIKRPEDLLGDKGLMKELKVRLMERMLGADDEFIFNVVGVVSDPFADFE